MQFYSILGFWHWAYSYIKLIFMSPRSVKEERLYKIFKEEAKVITMKSVVDGTPKKIIKWRGKTFLSASMKDVFDLIKHELK